MTFDAKRLFTPPGIGRKSFSGNLLIMRNCPHPHIPILLIIGPPRSGTSIMGRVLATLPAVSTWVEPYFVWDRFFRTASHDERTASDATEIVCRQIRRDFDRYRRGMGAQVVVDKSPRNCLRIPFVRTVFPDARYLFLSRDGRDAVLSIKQQWKNKEGVFTGSRQGKKGLQLRTIFGKWLARRPLWRFRFRAFAFELGPWRQWRRTGMLNRVRWEGRFGWGPRFRGWQNQIEESTPIQFYAHQWAACASGMLREKDSVASDHRLDLRYENFVDRPKEVLERITAFMQIDPPKDFMKQIPEILAGNYGKWKTALSKEEIRQIGPILNRPLIDFGYETDGSWYGETG